MRHRLGREPRAPRGGNCSALPSPHAASVGKGRRVVSWQYLCSESTMYRILRAHGEVRERRAQATHPAKVKPELVATAAGQMFSWDITKLQGPGRGQYFHLYVMLDIFSRYVVGWTVAAAESAELAKAFIEDVTATHGVPQAIHADRGTSMTSKPVAQLLTDLGVTRSHSRPGVCLATASGRPSDGGMVSQAGFTSLAGDTVGAPFRRAVVLRKPHTGRPGCATAQPARRRPRVDGNLLLPCSPRHRRSR